MTKLKLTKTKRLLLTNYARKVVIAIIRNELNADTLDAQVEAMVHKQLDHEYPIEDMRTLARYDVAVNDETIRVMLRRNGELVQRQTQALKLSQARPLPAHRGYESIAVILEGPEAEAWFDYKSSIPSRVSERVSDYSSIIRQARNYEELLEVWPGAEAMRDELGAQNLLEMIPVTGAVMQRIHQDMIQLGKLGPVLNLEELSVD